MICLVGVLANLDDSEESEAFHADHAIDLRIDLESHRAARLLQNLEFVLENRVLLL